MFESQKTVLDPWELNIKKKYFENYCLGIKDICP